jgi:elongation factor G
MAVRNPSEIRNIAVVGHGGCGKTTLVERMLFAAGNTKRMGSVEEGNTVTDYSEEARKYKHSLSIVPVQFEHKGKLVNVLDTPGLSDFLGQAVAALAAVETAIVVVDAVRGVESTTRRLMAVAAERGLPRLVVVNKIESSEADLAQIIEDIRGARVARVSSTSSRKATAGRPPTFPPWTRHTRRSSSRWSKWTRN